MFEQKLVRINKSFVFMVYVLNDLIYLFVDVPEQNELVTISYLSKNATVEQALKLLIAEKMDAYGKAISAEKSTAEAIHCALSQLQHDGVIEFDEKRDKVQTPYEADAQSLANHA